MGAVEEELPSEKSRLCSLVSDLDGKKLGIGGKFDQLNLDGSNGAFLALIESLLTLLSIKFWPVHVGESGLEKRFGIGLNGSL